MIKDVHRPGAMPMTARVSQDHLDFLKEGGVLLYDSDNVEPNLDDKRFVYVGVPITGLTVEALGGRLQCSRQGVFRARESPGSG